jgi:hypothetical protein
MEHYIKELERLYEIECKQHIKIDSLTKKLNLALSCLKILQTDKWARTQVLKYQESTIGQVIDNYLLDIENIKD